MDRYQMMLDYREDIEKRRLPPLREQLEPLLNGTMRTFEQPSGAPQVETTQRDITRLKADIAQYERIADQLRKDFP